MKQFHPNQKQLDLFFSPQCSKNTPLDDKTKEYIACVYERYREIISELNSKKIALDYHEKARALQKMLDSELPLFPPLKQHLWDYIEYLNSGPDHVGAKFDLAPSAFVNDMFDAEPVWEEMERKQNEKT